MAGTSRYSSKQLFLKSFAESRFLRNAPETIAEQSFPCHKVLSQVDWKTLQKAFDALLAPSLWAHTSVSKHPLVLEEFWKHEVHFKSHEADKLKYQKLVQALPLRASGSKTALFDLLGRTKKLHAFP